MSILWKILAAFVASISFAVLYRVQKQELLIVGLVGTIGWLVSYLIGNGSNQVVAIFAAATTVALGSEIFARRRWQPVPVFLVPGIIPLVPGGQAYQTMLSFLQGNHLAGVEQLVNTLFLAGAIAGGIMLVSSLFRQSKIS